MVNMNNLVKDLCNKCENSICENHRGCAFRSLSNEYCDEVERLDLYINQLQQKNQQLKEQLKKRDEVIENIKLDDFENSMKDIYTTSVNENTIDESPMVYKPMQEIIDCIKDTIDIEKVIKPIYNFKASEDILWKN